MKPEFPVYDPFEDPLSRQAKWDEYQHGLDHLFRPILGDDSIFKIEWLVEGFIAQGYLTLLAGPPKSGKTCLATARALAVATGTDFDGKRTEQGGVLWLFRLRELARAVLRQSPTRPWGSY